MPAARVRYLRPQNVSFRGVSPFDPQYLTNSAWKPLVILEQLTKLPVGGLLLYGDASTRILKPLDEDVFRACGGASRQVEGGDGESMSQNHKALQNQPE